MENIAPKSVRDMKSVTKDRQRNTMQRLYLFRDVLQKRGIQTTNYGREKMWCSEQATIF